MSNAKGIDRVESRVPLSSEALLLARKQCATHSLKVTVDFGYRTFQADGAVENG